MTKNLLTRVSKTLHLVSSCWVLVLAAVIVSDVVGRSVFNHPVRGTAEIVKNSVVAITFLQIPLAILTGSMLRTTIILDAAGPRLRSVIELAACVLGVAFFFALAWGSYQPLLDAWRIGEYEGEGALRVPTYPVRAIVVVMAVMATGALLWQILRILSGKKHTV